MHHKKHKKNLKIMAVLFAVSWIAAIIFASLFIKEAVENAQYSRLAEMVKQRFDTFGKEDKQSEAQLSQKSMQEDSAMNFIQWQFVLKDQIGNANSRLQEEINKSKGLKKDKALAGFLYYNLGLGKTLALDFRPAISAFEEAVLLNPKDAHSFYNLGLLYSTYGQNPKQAVRCYQKYLELFPDSPDKEEIKNRIEKLKSEE